MQKLFFTFLALFFLIPVSGQTSFNTEPPIFITEFTKFMSDAKKPALAKTMESFNANWKTNKYTPEQQVFIIRIANSMMYKQMPRDPYFELMVNNMELVLKNKLNPAIFKQWQVISMKLLEKNQKEYQSFLETCNSLFADNTLTRSEARRWYTTSNNFELTYINNRIAIVFKNTELICQADQDKIKIANCAGTFYPDKKIWVGTQGRINWERVGKPESEVYATFTKHQIDMNTGSVSADSALLSYPKISTQKILGKLNDRVSQTVSADQVKKSSFPQFYSSEPTIEIKGIVGANAIYKGGFSMEGAQVNSQSIGQGLAKIILLYKGKPFVEVISDAFRLDSGKVMSQAASVRIKADTGYIYHPKVIFNYNIEKKKMILNKGTNGLMRMPFADNYHGVEIDVEQVIWEQDKPYIDFDMISNDKTAYVETNTFFKKFLYESWQGALASNPIEKLFYYCRTNASGKKMSRAFTIQDYANSVGSTKEYLEQQIIDMSDGGFLFYNRLNDSIYVRDKLYNWIANNGGGKDYDIIRFSSVIGGKPNLTFNLNSFDLKMEGVRKFTFSDSQNVVSMPKDQLVIIKKDKNLHFAGQMRAGRIDFYSKDFNFDYSQFMIQNTTMDSMVIFYPDLNTNALRKVQSVLSNTYGRILIDKPNNKSGLKNYAEYPIFIAERGSEINYDRAATHNHAYKADRFVFEIDPFTIDSLDNFTIAGFAFGGTLKSDGIFPDIKNKASIQPDYSLGFVDKVNLPMYGGKGTGDLVINLSNRGFYGSGDLLYQTSVSKSPEYLLLPDATVGNSSSFNLPESGKYPLVSGFNVKTEWFPKQDKMFQTKLDSNFSIFKSKYDFDGRLTLSPLDLRGEGRLLWPEAVFASNDMVFGRNKADAAVSSIKIYAVDPTKFAFESNNVKGNVDFDKREGKFLTNVLGSYTNFPFNNYSSNMNDYKWDMTKKTMEIKPNVTMAGIKPMFVGLPQNTTDSVRFECAYAKFDLTKFILNLEKIPFIDIADSRVYPFAGKAIVRERAAMDRLDSSRIEANRIDKFHEIKNCHTTILGGNSLNADGYYRYLDKYKTEQPLYVDSIRINKDKNLVGYGRIAEDKAFRLDKKIGFKGLFEVISTRKPIQFIGYVRPMHSFTFMETSWLRYNYVVDPQNVIINVLNPRDKDNNKLSVGLYFANDSNHVYPIMFDLKRRYSDPELQSDTGILFYNAAKDAFFVGNEAKLLKKSLRGNYMQYNEVDKSVYAEGKFNFNLVTQKAKIETAGTAIHAAGDSTFRFNLMMWLSFPLPAEVNAKITKFLTADGAGKPPGSLKNEDSKKALAELITDTKTFEKMQKSVDATGILPSEGEFKTGFVFSNVNFGYNRIKRKFLGTGNITMPLFNGQVINKSYDATVAIEKKKSGDKIIIYIVADNGEWLYMEYVRGNMIIATNNTELAAAVSAASDKLFDPEFSLRLGTEKTKDNFLIKNDVDQE